MSLQWQKFFLFVSQLYVQQQKYFVIDKLLEFNFYAFLKLFVVLAIGAEQLSLSRKEPS